MTAEATSSVPETEDQPQSAPVAEEVKLPIEVPAPANNEASESAPSADAGAVEAGAATAAEQPALVDVWRPGRAGRSEGRRHRPRRREAGKEAVKRTAQPLTEETVATDAPATEPAIASPPEQTSPPATPHSKEGRHFRHRRRPDHRADRPQRERDRPPVKRFERREKAPDPNSPFAKLAALKAQLEADAKEGR
jgi:ATP-dependent RNA helicase SUPV3L1/SUV3